MTSRVNVILSWFAGFLAAMGFLIMLALRIPLFLVLFLVLSALTSLFVIWLANFKKRQIYSLVAKNIESLPSIEVIISAKNERGTLGACLSRILQSGYPKLMVTVVDDASDDGTSEEVEELLKKYNNLRLIVNDQPQGKLNNVLKVLSTTKADFAVIVDADTYFEEGYLDSIVNYMNHRGIWAVESRLISYNFLDSFAALVHDTELRIMNFWRIAVPQLITFTGRGVFLRREAFAFLIQQRDQAYGFDDGAFITRVVRDNKIPYDFPSSPPLLEKATVSFGSLVRQRIRWFHGTILEYSSLRKSGWISESFYMGTATGALVFLFVAPFFRPVLLASSFLSIVGLESFFVWLSEYIGRDPMGFVKVFAATIVSHIVFVMAQFSSVFNVIVGTQPQWKKAR
ncbi:MAG TPA: hypothetical protein DHV12_08345 [Thermotogae bacterium]|nr:hypothetical protein [Thermotogota bacterium]